MTDRAHLQLTRRKVRDQSVVLWVVGAAAILPPVAGISLVDGEIGGLPVPLVYIFIVWILLIAGAALLARPLLDADDAISSAEPADTED